MTSPLSLSALIQRAEAFWGFVDRRGPDDCWIFKGALVGKGYGRFYDGRRGMRAHRFAWSITNGAIPEGMMVCHACDNRLCVNPSHLFLGTAQDNFDDMMRKGRFSTRAVGTRVNTCKMTPEIVMQIRRTHTKNYTQIARKMGLHHSTVRQAAIGLTWKQVPFPSRPDTET